MADIMKYIVDDAMVDTDPHGYLLNLDDWSEDLATTIASTEGVTLTDEHWDVLRLLRKYYSEYGSSPNARLLVKAMQKEYGPDKGTKKRLYELFPHGPSRSGCKIAGLPLPNDCIDWPA